MDTQTWTANGSPYSMLLLSSSEDSIHASVNLKTKFPCV
jgi:hypothetical protein